MMYNYRLYVTITRSSTNNYASLNASPSLCSLYKVWLKRKLSAAVFIFFSNLKAHCLKSDVVSRDFFMSVPSLEPVKPVQWPLAK